MIAFFLSYCLIFTVLALVSAKIRILSETNKKKPENFIYVFRKRYEIDNGTAINPDCTVTARRRGGWCAGHWA
jgi:hypothetical protein